MTQHTREGWRSRIIGHGEEAPDQLLAHPENWRIHPKPQQDALAGVLDEVGWVQDVIVNQRTGHVIDGHLRVSLAIGRREATVPVVYVDLDEHEERLVLATIDPISAMAATDAAKLDELLREVSTGDAAVQAMLSSVAAKSGLLPIDDPNAEWQGMPEFEQNAADDVHKSIVVKFESEQDYQSFAALVDQPLTPQTVFIWHPYKPTHGVPGSMQGYRVEDES